MSTSISDKQECDIKSPSGGNSLPISQYETQDEQLLSQSRPVPSRLSRLAELISHFEYQPKPKPPSSPICKDRDHMFPNLDSLVDHQETKQVLQKLHCCQHCGQKFALLSSLQLHRCPGPSPMCQTCTGKPQLGSSCLTCRVTPPQVPSFENDISPYVCAPCGQAFSPKRELLDHQQAGGCQPAPFKPSSPVASPTTSPPPSFTRNKRFSPAACTLCPRTFRSPAGLASHMRNFHLKNVSSKKGEFQCRSCDMVFSKTSLLYLHREEKHRREGIFAKPQKKSKRRKRRGGTYPCLDCGQVFLHHLTRRAHFNLFSAHHQAHLALSSKTTKDGQVGSRSKAAIRNKVLQEVKQKSGRPRKIRPTEKGKVEAVSKGNETVPQTPGNCKCCSVCSGGISLSEITEKNVYHCVPCAETFLALETFLEHCQKHLFREIEEDEDLLSDE